MGKFVIHTVDDASVKSFCFTLNARNGNVIATSMTFPNLSTCKKMIQSVIRVVAKAKLEDQCPQGGHIIAVTNPKFELYKDRLGAFHFRLKARNGEVLLNSGSYTTKASCKTGIKSVITSSEKADILIEA